MRTGLSSMARGLSAKNILCSLSLVLGVTCSGALADTTSTTTTTTSQSSGKTLQGTAASQGVALNASLRDMRGTVQKLKRTALELIGEVERKDVVIVDEPDVIGGIVIPAAPDPSGMMQMGDLLPPRKKWIDYYMTQIASLINLLDADINGVVIPPDQQAALSTLYGNMQQVLKDVRTDYTNLQALTSTKDLTNIPIGKQALGIYDDMNTLEKLRRSIESTRK